MIAKMLNYCRSIANLRYVSNVTMFAKLMWNCEIAHNLQIVTQYAKVQYVSEINVKFAAGRTLAIRRRILQNVPPPSASNLGSRSLPLGAS